MYAILAQFFPNNETRLTFSSLPQRKYIDSGEVESYPIGWQATTDSAVENLENKIPTSLSLVLNSKTQRSTAGYGDLPLKPTQFGSNARRQIMRAGGAMERSVNDPGECLFLTGTLPSSTEDSFRALAQWSGYVVNALKAWIANHISAKLDFYCWEYQKRGALHLHYCVHAQDAEARTHIQQGFKDWWIAILHRIGEKTSTDMFRKNSKYTHLSDPSKVRATAEVCRKSPARYLAKYLSKSARKLKGRARFFVPSRWWGTSRPLKAILKNLTKTIEVGQGSYFACIKKMQKLKTAFEACEGKYYPFNHKYGMGETLLIYPTNQTDNDNLFDQVSAMTMLNRLKQPAQNYKPSAVLKPHRTRLLEWSHYWMNALPERETGMIQSLKSFNEFLMNAIPSQSPEPLMIIHQWSNRLYNLSNVIGYSACGRNRDDRLLIDTVLDDLEVAIKHISYNGWQ